jgi:spermidine/putrescine transport system ATP-binding protein
MKSITIQHLYKAFHGESVLHDLSLYIPSGQIFVLLGPSGCGKTTLLRLIAGFEKVDSGTILLGSRDITHLDINKRPINTVFQNYALFPHLNVFDNIAYSLMVRKVPKRIIDEKVGKMLDTVRLEKFATKSISQLSGGQQQRVALARAIINEPDVLLLDEPLAALDSSLRERVLVDLIALQDTLKTTFIYVTHDQSEALTVADQIAVMNVDGEIEQIGRPQQIYEFPVSSHVAQFVGSTNILEGTLHFEGSDVLLQVPGLTPALHIERSSLVESLGEGASVKLSIRPEKMSISVTEQTGFSNMLSGTVEALVYRGRSTTYSVRLHNGMLVQVYEQNEEHSVHKTIDYDSKVFLYWQKENGTLLKK